jgi:kynureninase
MSDLSDKQLTLPGALDLDAADPLRELRERFSFPCDPENGQTKLYFAGHSLGLMPLKVREYVKAECDAWAQYGVEGHFEPRPTNPVSSGPVSSDPISSDYRELKHSLPWVSYHEELTPSLARLVGARESEVVAMNTLTVNLHLLLVSFYRPRPGKYKILIEESTFPSDRYAIASQVRFHGYDPNEAIVELKAKPGTAIIDTATIQETIEDHGDSLALILLGNVNYLTGQKFDFRSIVSQGHSQDAFVGFNLAHGAGNLLLSLHDDNVDFAVWCSYKYLNSGPGSLAGCFIHENHHGRSDIPRFEGWWGTRKDTRFEMRKQFEPISGVEAWQLSNPPILPMACMRASLEIFDSTPMSQIRQKGDSLTNYLEACLRNYCEEFCDILTPPHPDRAAMLCLRLTSGSKRLAEKLRMSSVVCDFREPDILRVAPVPLYNSFEDVFKLVQAIAQAHEEVTS